MENIKIYAAASLGLGFLVSLQLWRLHKKETAPTDFVSVALDSLRPPRPFDVLRERLLALTVILAGTFIWPFFSGGSTPEEMLLGNTRADAEKGGRSIP